MNLGNFWKTGGQQSNLAVKERAFETSFQNKMFGKFCHTTEIHFITLSCLEKVKFPYKKIPVTHQEKIIKFRKREKKSCIFVRDSNFIF